MGLAVLLLGGCCTGPQCLDRKSTPDRERVHAVPVKLKRVINDRVSSPDEDRTDWKSLLLKGAGELTVKLHWDDPRAKLELGVFDMLGAQIERGQTWAKDKVGLRAVVQIHEKGKYYIRVRAVGDRDGSTYALRVRFKRSGGPTCAKCTPAERKCLGKDAYVICGKVHKGCNAWIKTIACPSGVTCKDGRCGGCSDACTENERKCVGKKTLSVCARAESGCLAWGAPRKCKVKCRKGRCVGGGRPKPPDKPPPPKVVTPPKSNAVKARIISIYRYRGQMTLHIKVGENSGIKPGATGAVLEGDTARPLPGGQFKISKVSGQYAIATTSLERLGKNRWVRINLR